MNSERLRAAMNARGVGVNELKTALGISRSATSRRLNGFAEFNREDILKIRDFLELTDDELVVIFFTDEV